jgi:FkbH-like protein
MAATTNMDAFTRLKKNLKKDFSGLQPVRVALLGDTATQWMAQAIRGVGYERGLDLQLWEADFSQIGQQVCDPRSDLYAFDPQVILLYQSSQKLLGAYDGLEPGGRRELAQGRIAQVDSLRAAIRARSAASILYYNYPEIDDRIFGNYANKTDSSFLFQLRKLNYELMRYATEQEGFHIVDLAILQQQTGRAVFFRPSVYVNTDMEISIEALPAVADATVSLIGALYGRIRKCLVLDLDNTLWGGVIGDDGLEKIEIGALGIGKAFTDLQYWALKLRQRGILLAVCSKNTEAVARQPFDLHPDMVLRLEDIAVFQANWDNKVDNIRQIGAALNISLDSMVFLDDNPFERNMVREALPEVLVPELPDDPAEFLEYLYCLHLFETVSLSAEDEERTNMYRTDRERNTERLSYAGEEAYLASLNMVSRVAPFDNFNGPRVAQLSQRSNQFNLRTVRFTDAEVREMAESPDIFTFSFTLEDRFGDNGIICVVILRKETDEMLFIDGWFMSCRVLRRGMENFTLNTVARFARQNGFRYLRGEYLPTAKNGMVRDHYLSLGFVEEGGRWLLDVQTYEPRPTFVNRIEK